MLYLLYYHRKRGFGEMNLNLYGIEKHLKGMKGYLKVLDVNLKGCEHLNWMVEDLNFLGEHLKKMEDHA